MAERPEKTTNELSGLAGGHSECCSRGRRGESHQGVITTHWWQWWAAWGWRDLKKPPMSHQDSLVVVVVVGDVGGEAKKAHQ